MRADVFLVENGYAASRNEAQAAIAAGTVAIDGRTVVKPSQTVRAGAAVDYAPAHPYVSRGALKLIAALDGFGLSPAGRVCLDIGASTGGFTEVLLGRDAKRVYAVDVGHGQLHPKIAADPKVVSMEGVNIRHLDIAAKIGSVSAIVADVSFIGLKLALPPALDAAAADAWLVALVKPQFELGPAGIGKGGIVTDAAARDAAVRSVADWLAQRPDWRWLGTMPSPIQGGDGNAEYLIAGRRHDQPSVGKSG